MFDFAWSEIAILGILALVVIGPKDLPKALKTAGFAVRRARMMAREFQNSVDDMIRDAELQEIREQAAKAAGVDLNKVVQDAVDPGGDIRAAMAEPLGGPALAQEPAAPPPAVDGSAVEEASAEPAPETPSAGELPPPAEEPSIPKLHEGELVSAAPSEPDKPIPPDFHRNPPAP